MAPQVYVFFFFLELFLLFFLSRVITRSLSQLFFVFTKSQSVSITLLALFFFPGVVIHELSHLLTAAVLFVPVGEVEFMPKVEAQGSSVKLGSVAVGKTDPIRRAIIGFAPVVCGSAVIIGFLLYVFSSQKIYTSLPWWELVLGAYLLFAITNTMFSSKKDMEGTIEIGLTILVVSALLYFVGVRLSFSLIDLLVSARAQIILKTIDTLLLVPLGIDVLVYVGSKYVLRKKIY